MPFTVRVDVVLGPEDGCGRRHGIGRRRSRGLVGRFVAEKVFGYLVYARRRVVAPPADFEHAADGDPAALLEREEVLERARLERDRVGPRDGVASLGEAKGYVADARFAEPVALDVRVARLAERGVQAEAVDVHGARRGRVRGGEEGVRDGEELRARAAGGDGRRAGGSHEDSRETSEVSALFPAGRRAGAATVVARRRSSYRGSRRIVTTRRHVRGALS